MEQQFFQVREVAQICGMGCSTVWRKARAGQFPQPVQLSEGITRWRRVDLESWLADPAGWCAEGRAE